MIRRNSFRGGLSGSAQKVTIRLLDDNEVIQVDFQPHHKGQFLMDYVCRQLNIAEKDYFGLRYVDSTKQRHWMDLGKSITKQLKEMTPYIICFRFKFYPGDPMLLKEEVSRYQLVLQLRRDLLHGRLHSSSISEIATLSSYIVQSELGDYDPDVHTGNYVAEYELMARQSSEVEEKVKDLHSKLKGVTASESDALFLKKAASLDTYGVDPHPVKDQQGEQLFLGINYAGISTFQGSKKLAHFKWPQITKLNYEAKMFIVHISLSEDSRNRKKETAGFKCQTAKSCKYLWRCAVEQRFFFTCPNSVDAAPVRGGGLFGSRFRYSGKVQKEILEDPGPLRAIDGVLQRTPLYRSLQRNKTRSLSQSPMQLGYGSLPRSNHSAPSSDIRIEGGMRNLGSSGSLPLSTLSSPFGPEQSLPLLETLEEDSSPADDKDFTSDPVVENEVNSLGGSAADTKNEDSKHNTFFVAASSYPTFLPIGVNDAVRNGNYNGPQNQAGVEGEGEVQPTLFVECARDAVVADLAVLRLKPDEDDALNDIGCVNGAFSLQENGDLSNYEKMAPSPKKRVSSSTLAQEKRRKFGISSGPKVESLVIGGGAAWAVVRKQLGRFNEIGNKNSRGGDMPYNKLDSEDPLIPTNSSAINETMDNNAEDLPSYPVNLASVDPENSSNASAILNRDDVISEFIPSFASEFSPGERGDEEKEKVLRDSKIDKIEIPTSEFPQILSTIPSLTSGKNSSTKQGRIILSMWKIFVVSMICVLVALLFVAILAIEVDIDICQKMRRIPEVELFQTEVYEPVKYFIRNKIHNISDNISFPFQ